MTIIEAIQEVFLNVYPSGTFAFTSEIQGDKDEHYKDKTTSTPFCLIAPNVTGEVTVQNGQFNDRLRLKVFFLTSNTDNWKTYTEKESTIVEAMRQLGAEVLTRVLYQYPSIITVDESTTIPHTDLYNWGSGNHAGVMFDFAVKQKRELNLCSTPITFDLILSSGANGTTVPDPGTYNFDKGDSTAIYAAANPGFKFGQWLVNGAANLINPISLVMTKAYTVVAEFVVSEIKQLTIAVSGTGTTNPIPGNYDIGSGGAQLIEAIETDANYVFSYFDQDGDITMANPNSFTVIENSLVVAYFVYKWIQHVFGNAVQKLAGLTYFIDRSPSVNNVQVKNIQVGNFNGSVWMSYNMTGLTIASYESDGVGIPTKTNDSRIDITTGLVYSITLSNGAVCYFNEGSKDRVYFTDGTYAMLENVVLATFWNTKNDAGTSGLHLRGYSKYLNCVTAGITVDDIGSRSIDATYEFTVNKSVTPGDAQFRLTNINGTSRANNQGYQVWITNTLRVGLTKCNIGSDNDIFYTDINYVEPTIDYSFRLIVTPASEFTLYIKGGAFADWTLVVVVFGSNPMTDTTYTTIRYIQIESIALSEYYGITIDGNKIDVDNFAENTGVYETQKVIGQTALLDARGNELEIPANVISNSGNTFDGVQVTGITAGATYSDIYALETDANKEITKTAAEEMGYVSELKILTL